jgi:serine/threonine protein kinase
MSILRDPMNVPPGSIGDETTAPRTAAAMPARLPQNIGKYQVLERLGAGAMGIVYKCRQPDLDRPVAVKVMLAAHHAGADQLARFHREARAASRLAHANVVQIFDIGVDGECTYFVMEYVDGCSLDRLIGTEWLSLERTLRLVYQVAQALESAHRQQIVHRDIKPSNILIDKSGQIKLADFGLAKTLYDSKALSGSGDLIGTPRYMSPEQVLAAPEEVDARTDIYSLGAVMYEMLTARPPVDGPNLLATLRQLTDDDPAPIEELNSAVPEDVASICRRAMAKDRENRYAAAGQFAEAIQACLVRRLMSRPIPVGATHDSLLSLALPATVVPARRGANRRLLVWSSAACVALALGLWGWAARRPANSEDTLESSSDDSEGAERPILNTAALINRVQKQLAGTLEVPEGMMPRDRYKSIIEDLTAVLKRGPANHEARLLRARAYRRTGEHMAAIEDLNELLARDRRNLPAVQERLLANYEFFVLYLGNLNELLLRPRVAERLKDDADVLSKGNDPVSRAMAEVAAALARQDYNEAARLTGAAPARKLRREQVPDWCMLECDAASHAAASAYAEELSSPDETKGAARLRRQELDRRATQAWRSGLDADPSHVGLLFLKANSFQRTAAWSVEEGEDHATALNRQRLAFERTFDLLRRATLRVGGDTALARAVLLSNFDRNDPALEQITDALSYRPTVPYLYTLKAWLKMQVPSDGILSAEETDRILRDFQAVLEPSPEEYNTYFVRALLHAAAGHWELARSDLRRCRNAAASDTIPVSNGDFQQWFSSAGDTTSRFLNATITVLYYVPVPTDVRVKLSEELLKRLTAPAMILEDNLPAEEVANLKGSTHMRLAEAYAEREDRARVLQHVREALAQNVADVTPQSFREHGTLSAWNEDDEFKALYAEYSPHE